MLSLLWLIPFLPLTAFVVLALLPLRRRAVAVIGAGLIALDVIIAGLVAGWYIAWPPAGNAFRLTIWDWIHVAGLDATVGLYLDALSGIFILIITGVGFAIILYSTKFMASDAGYRRFFAYMNLFVASMLTLVLADNMVLLYLGWEGVGLCSYLLIGFWYTHPDNGRAARKAFYVTRVGDAAMAVGLLLLFTQLGTLQIMPMLAKARLAWPVGSAAATAAALLLLGGAVGKSAQLPLQTWLPDAMAGPTPVSALIHAATMVTAGVYLVARTHVIFELSPAAMVVVAWIGAVTLVLASFSGIVQKDIKRVLAYSTISQIGYMFLALGAGAWAAAVYHFITHALFKSALFLGAGVLILHLQREHNIFRMGGLRKIFPVTFRAFLMAGLTLSALPPLTLTFNSKDVILRQVFASSKGGPVLWAMGLLGALLTAMYTFRMIFVVFFGPVRKTPRTRPSRVMLAPLVFLAVCGGLAGIAELLSVFFGINGFYEFLHRSLPAAPVVRHVPPGSLQAVSIVTALLGIAAVYWAYMARPALHDRLRSSRLGRPVRAYLFAGWGFDWAYDRLFVRPYCWFARVNAADAIDRLMTLPAWIAELSHTALSLTQTGQLRWYAMGLAAGAIVLVGILVWL